MLLSLVAGREDGPESTFAGSPIALEWRVCMALSEFVNITTWCAHPKQARIADMVNATRPKVSGALHSLESKGVINIDRCKTYCRYVFTETWRSAFRSVSRCSPTEHHRGTVRTEP